MESLFQALRFLGEEGVRLEIQAEDLAECRPREVLGRVYPTHPGHIKELVEISGRLRIALYPVSRGRNWGMGSSKPVQGGGLIVDFARMNRILEVNERFRYAVIEPGVTQGQLAKRLEENHPSLLANTGGAGSEASVVGNILERGSGFLGCKVDDILGLEAVLGNGAVIRTGFWNFAADEAPSRPFVQCYPFGIGPDLRGLFVQSGMGIVTRMAVRLSKKTPQTLFSVSFKTDKLGEVVDRFKLLYENSLLSRGMTVTELHDGNIYYPSHREEWRCYAPLSGPVESFSVIRGVVERFFEGFREGDAAFYDIPLGGSDKSSLPEWVETLRGRYNGKVTNAHLQNLWGKEITQEGKCDLDDPSNKIGFLCLNTVVPFDGKFVSQARDAVRDISRAHGMRPTVCFTFLNEFSLKGHFSVNFERSAAQAKKCHEWKDALYEALLKIGCYPQRLDIDSMSTFTFAGRNAYWRMLEDIKCALDPGQIISPGRYLTVTAQDGG